jgi:hypothetical protein
MKKWRRSTLLARDREQAPGDLQKPSDESNTHLCEPDRGSSMALPISTTTAVQPNPFAVIARKHRDGSVLLSVAHDRVFKLNGVGALTWTVLEESAVLSLDEVVDQLFTQFGNINAGGEMQYDVAEEQLRQDTAHFLKSLAEAGLVRVLKDSRGTQTYQIKEDVSGTTSHTFAELSGSKQPDISSCVPSSFSPASTIHPTRWETLTALFALFAFDLLLRFRGFEALIRRVESWPIVEPSRLDPDLCRRICAMVNRAQIYYPKKAMCLQHSAVVTCLLRRKGVPARMVLAAQEFPPKGHAWVEVKGEVVNDKPTVKEIYRILRRV